MALIGFDDTQVNLGRIWDFTDAEAEVLIQRLLLQKLDQFRVTSSDWYAKLKKLPQISDVEPRWLEEKGYPRTLTGTLSGTSPRYFTVTGNLFGASPTRASMLQCVRTDAVLFIEIAGVISAMKVSAVDATNPILTVTATGGTSLPTNAAGMVVNVTNEPFSDAAPAENPRFLGRDYRGVSTEIFSDTFQIEKTRKHIKMALGISELDHQINELLIRLRDLHATSCIYSYPEVSGGVVQTMLKTAKPRLCGLIWWFEELFGSGGDWENNKILVDMGGKPVDVEDFDKAALEMVNQDADFGKGDWQAWMHPNARWYLHESGQFMRRTDRQDKVAGYGVETMFLKSCGKEIPVYQDVRFPKTRSFLLDMSNLGHGNFEDDDLSRGKLAADSIRNERWQITDQLYGLVVRNTKNIGACLKNTAAAA